MLEENMKVLRKLNNISQKELASKLFVTPQAVSKWERGESTPNPEALIKMATTFGVTVDQLLGNQDISITSASGSIEQDSNFVPYQPTGTVPVLGRIAAGVPIAAVEDVEGYEPVTVSDPENCYYLRVDGDSMIGAGIQSGDLVLIRQQPTADNGQIVACKVNGEEATLKRFRQQGGTVVLMPENPNYEPIIVPAKDFETGRAQIFGVAIEVKRKL